MRKILLFFMVHAYCYAGVNDIVYKTIVDGEQDHIEMSYSLLSAGVSGAISNMAISARNSVVNGSFGASVCFSDCPSGASIGVGWKTSSFSCMNLKIIEGVGSAEYSSDICGVIVSVAFVV